MRHLTQPGVLKSAGIAGLASALACYPRVAMWPDRPHLIWFLEAILLASAAVLWGFVFGWHAQYSQRPVFSLKVEPRSFFMAALAGALVAAILHFFLDPSLRLKIPTEYPGNYEQWMAMLLFNLGFQQLFFIFAPFAFFIRLFHSARVAAGLTVLFGTFVVLLKLNSLGSAMPAGMASEFLILRLGMAFLSLYFYLQGGVLLVCCWGLLIQMRHLLDLACGT